MARKFFNFNLNDTLVSSTRTRPVNIFTWKKEKPYARDTKISCPGQSVVHSAGCCGVNEQQHNQDLRESKAERILEFITFYQNALHLTRVQCGTFYQSGLRHF